MRKPLYQRGDRWLRYSDRKWFTVRKIAFQAITLESDQKDADWETVTLPPKSVEREFTRYVR